MSNSAHSPVDHTHNIEQLLAALEKKEQEIHFLKKKHEENGRLALAQIGNTDEENHPSLHVSLQEKIIQVAFHLLFHEKKIDSVSQNLLEKINSLESHNKKTDDYRQRLESIENRFNLLEKKRIENLRGKIREFFRPRLGSLYQYNPKPFVIPKRYFKPILLPSSPPMISIVTPSFNQGEFLERTILSITGQRYPALEYVIQDGGSEDHSVEVIKHYEPLLKHWESATDNGQSQAINLGFRHTSGEIMAYLNSDDILLPGTLHYVAKFFHQHPDVDVVYGHRVLINQNDHEIGRWTLPPHDSNVLYWADYIPQETVFWRRRIWEKAGGKIDESFRFAMDWDLLLRFSDLKARFVRLPRFLGAFRIHTSQKTSTQISQIGEKEMERLRIRSHGRLVTPYEISKQIRHYLIKHIFYNKLYRLGLLRY